MTFSTTIPTPKTTRSVKETRRIVNPIIPLDRPTRANVSKSDSLTFKLRAVPTEADSSTYELTVPYFKTGKPEELLNFIRDLRKIIVGQNVTTGPNQFALARRLLQGDALAAFDRAAEATGAETVVNFKTVLGELIKHVFPKRAISTQKRYMRRFLRKPREWKTREFAARLVEINELLKQFPPFRDDQQLDTDELLEILEFAVPATWQKAMVLQGFDPLEHTVEEFVEFCERLEFSEDLDETVKGTKSQSDPKDGKSTGYSRAKSSAGGKKRKQEDGATMCPLHLTTDHDANQCLVLRDQAKKMRGMWEAKGKNRSGSDKGKFQNFRNGGNGSKNPSTKTPEVNVIQETVRDCIREMFATQKKRKHNNDEEEEFNVEEFLKMNIEDSDEEVVDLNNTTSSELEEYFGLDSVETNSRTIKQKLLNPKKQIKTNHLVPATWGRMKDGYGRKDQKMVRILLDSGASGSIISKRAANKLRMKRDKETKWSTAAGNMNTNYKTKTLLELAEFSHNRVIECTFHVSNATFNYDIIMGRDLMTELGIDISFKNLTIEWDGEKIPMKEYNGTFEETFNVENLIKEDEDLERIKRILDAKYEKADLNKVVENCTHLTPTEKQKLYNLLKKYEDLFDGTLGKWKGEPYHIELKEGATPYHARAWPIPKIHEQTLRLEIDRLCKLGVLRKINRSQWGANTFVIPKKDQTVRFITDFRELNKRIKRKPYPLPNIKDLLYKLENFTYGTTLDLNMGYYHIELDLQSQQLCAIILPWGKYEYQRLPMGLCNSPDIFQEKVNTLFQELEWVRAYIDDVLCISTKTWDDHLDKLEKVFNKLQQAGLKVNANKSKFGMHSVEYLGYIIGREGISPVPKKVEAILKIKEPKNKKELKRFLGMINFYKDFWIRRSEILAPLTELTSEKKEFKWTEEHTKAFDTIKRVVSKEVLLAYPNYDKPFQIFTDASKVQLGAVICQENKPIAFFSKKLNSAQTRYTTTERELLAIVETLKEFRNMLLGYEIIIYTDHQNLTYKNFNTNRVLRWRLILEEYGPKFIYLPGKKNIVADALSRLELDDSKQPTEFQSEVYNITKEEINMTKNPITYTNIAKHQQKDKNLIKLAKNNKDYSIKSFCGGGKEHHLIVHNDKIVIPKQLQRTVVNWYHTQLCHPGETRTEATIRQHFTFKGLKEMVHKLCKTCPTCQKTKLSTKKYGKIPPKVAESIPWDKLCVDLIGPYTIKINSEGEKATLWAVTMIDPATGWFEMKQIRNKEAIEVANIVETTWLSRYPWPTQIVYDKGTEFMGEFAKMVENDYQIKRKGITVRNPQANSILERIHQTLGNILRTFELHQEDYQTLENTTTWDGILAAAMFALRTTYHTTLQATPAQLVFHRDAVLNIPFQPDWLKIKERKQKEIIRNNERENDKRIKHKYKSGDKVLIRTDFKSKYSQNPYDGPYEITQVYDNGTVTIKKKNVYERYNIRLLKPYYEN